MVSGMLALILGLDDTFLLHEVFFPYLGISEKLIYVSYAGCVLFCLFRFYSVILNTEYVLLGMDLVFFGVSVTLGLFDINSIDPYLFEDGSELVGIVS